MPNNPSAQNTAYYNHVEGTNNYFSSYDGQFKAPESDATYIASNNNTENYIVDYNKLNSLGIRTITNTTNGSYYWLASRNVVAFSFITNFAVRYVNSSGTLINYSLCSVDSSGSPDSNRPALGLRPVITLKSNIKITETNNKKYISIEE